MASAEVQRMRLLHERTYLAWWRTGLAGIAAGFGVGRVLPDVLGGQNWPYVALGTALAAAGLAAMVYGIVHYRELQAALREEREPRTGEGFLLAMAAVGTPRVIQGARRTSRTDAAPTAIPTAESASMKPSPVRGSRSSRSDACSSR